MAKIQDKSWRYSWFKIYVDFMFKSAYRRVEYHGKENIPQDGAIIFASNHTSTLMDALAVLAINPTAKVFVARADLFKLPAILKFLTFLKMMPINRKRDGLSSLMEQNTEINNIAVDVLRDKIPFCILPEGTHQAKYSLLPLQKGIFRIALQANDTFGKEMPVYIVPVGITYGHFFRYRSSMLVMTGKPVNITQFIKEHPEYAVPQQQINALREELGGLLKNEILYVPNDANYNPAMELVQLYGNEQQQRLGLNGNSLLNRFKASKETITNITGLLQSNPQDMQELLSLTGEFSRQRHALGIGMKSVIKSRIRLSLVWETILLILGFPYFLFSALVSSPLTILYVWISAKFADKAFHNTIQYLIVLAFFPTLLLLLGVTVALIFPWIWALVFVLLSLPAFYFFYDYLHLAQTAISDVKWLIHKDLQKQFKHIKALFAGYLFK